MLVSIILLLMVCLSFEEKELERVEKGRVNLGNHMPIMSTVQISPWRARVDH